MDPAELFMEALVSQSVDRRRNGSHCSHASHLSPSLDSGGPPIISALQRNTWGAESVGCSRMCSLQWVSQPP